MNPSRTNNAFTNVTPSPGPWENAAPQRPRHVIRRLHRRQLVDRVRLLLLRQKRTYSRRLEVLQEQYQRKQTPNSELIENNKELRLTIDVPGVNRSDIQVDIDPATRILSVSAKRFFMSLDDVTCRRTHMMCRRYRIHSNVMLQIHATLQNGVLTISAPKTAPPSTEPDREKDVETSFKSPVQECEKHNPVIVIPISQL